MLLHIFNKEKHNILYFKIRMRQGVNYREQERRELLTMVGSLFDDDDDNSMNQALRTPIRSSQPPITTTATDEFKISKPSELVQRSSPPNSSPINPGKSTIVFQYESSEEDAGERSDGNSTLSFDEDPLPKEVKEVGDFPPVHFLTKEFFEKNHLPIDKYVGSHQANSSAHQGFQQKYQEIVSLLLSEVSQLGDTEEDDLKFGSNIVFGERHDRSGELKLSFIEEHLTYLRTIHRKLSTHHESEDPAVTMEKFLLLPPSDVSTLMARQVSSAYQPFFFYNF